MGIYVSHASGQVLRLTRTTRGQPASYHRFGRTNESHAKPVALQVGPVLELGGTRHGELRKEVSGVEPHRLLQIHCIDRCQEGISIRSHGDLQHQVSVFTGDGVVPQPLAQGQNRLGQGVSGGLGFQVGPQQAGQMLAAGGPAGGASQIDEQG